MLAHGPSSSNSTTRSTSDLDVGPGDLGDDEEGQPAHILWHLVGGRQGSPKPTLIIRETGPWIDQTLRHTV